MGLRRTRILGAAVATMLLCTPAPGRAQDAAPLTLAEAIEQARTRNPDLRAVERLREGAAEGARRAVPWLNPVFELRTENLGAPDPPVGPTHDVFAVLSQPVELPGKRRARRALAGAASTTAEARLGEARGAVSLATALAYLGALRYHAVHALLEEHHAGVAELVRVLRERVAAAAAAEGDLRRLELALATVDVSRLRARLDRDRELGVLAALTASDRPIAAGRLVRPAVPAVPHGVAAVEAAVARRPDVVAAQAKVAETAAARDFEAARWLPDPTIVGGYKRTAGVDTAVGGLVITLPFGDRNRGARAVATAAADAAVLELEAVRRRAHAAIESAIAAEAALVARLAGNAALDEAATIARTAVRTAFAEGTVDVVRLLDAEQAWLGARREVEELAFDALAAAVRARAAAGEELVP